MILMATVNKVTYYLLPYEYGILISNAFSTGHPATNICLNCNANRQESSIHFRIQCPHFAHMRRTIFNPMEQKFIPNFKKSLKRQQHT